MTTDTIAEASRVASQVMGFRSESGRELIRDIVAAAAPHLGAAGVYEEVRAERERAHAKHGDTSMESAAATSPRRLSILMEEVGEVAREFNEAHHRTPADAEVGPNIDLGKLRAELIQCAAMAVAWADVLATS